MKSGYKFISTKKRLCRRLSKNPTLHQAKIGFFFVFIKNTIKEQTTYDRAEATAKNQIYPTIGDKVVGNITATDIKNLFNHLMNKGLAYSTVKKAYVLLNEYFKILYIEELINKNPMDNVEMIKRANFLSSQGKEFLPECETVTVFTKECIYIKPLKK